MKSQQSFFLSRQHSLLAHSVVWVVLPVFVLTIGLALAAVAIYQQSITALIIDRDRQVASLAAESVSEGLLGYERVLAALAGNADIYSNSDVVRRKVFDTTGGALSVFNAGVIVINPAGDTLTGMPITAAITLGPVVDQDYFQNVRSRRMPTFSSVINSPVSGEPLIVVAVPITDENNTFAGALLGIIDLRSSALSTLVQNIIVGNNGVAYLVGQRGRVIYHPNASLIGADYSGRPSVAQVILGRSGGLFWQTLQGARYVDGYAPVSTSGWGLIVQESWEMAAAPTQAHFALLAFIALLASMIAVVVLWFGVRQITAPVQAVSEQTRRLAAGSIVIPISTSHISEVDTLAGAFNRMAAQIETYRAGLRRYVGAITNSQEDERLRISRDLHDETVQSLMAIGRRIELYQASEQDPQRLGHLQELHTMVDDTVHGVRQISRDLRPLILDDLGIVPALRTLVRGLHEGEDAMTDIDARLDVSGIPIQLTSEQELAIYRITQEALNNVRRHAQAQQVNVTLTYYAKEIKLDIHDNGVGFAPPMAFAELAEMGHFGLMSIQERVWAVGGTLSFDSTLGKGTRIAISIPVVVERMST